MFRIAKWSVSLALIGGLVFAPSALGDTQRVRATANNNWSPDFRHIYKGDRIVWKNPAGSGRPHNVVASSNNWNKSTMLDPGESTRKKFRRTGSYDYKCTIHSGMRMRLTVK